MPTNAELTARRAAAVPRGVAAAHPIGIVRAENAELYDADGRRYIDFAGGIGVQNTGHRNPRVLAAVARQLDALIHTSFQVATYEPYVALAEALNAIVPGATAKRTLLVSTGAEAVENAVKIARAATGRAAVIAFGGAFHGRTLFTLALTGKTKPYKEGFGPLPGPVYHVAFPSHFHRVTDDDVFRAIDVLFRSDLDPASVAAVIIEPVQGEGGFHVAPPEFLRRLRALTARHGILLIADEIQSGFGRTGRMFAIEHSGVFPDLVTTAKSLAAGFPLAAVTGRADIMDRVAPGGLGGTYGGNPVACAAALAVIDVIRDERLVERSAELGRRFEARFHEWRARWPIVADVRGLGAMVGIEFAHDGDCARPAGAFVTRVVADARDRGLLLLACGAFGNVIRMLVPITASDAVVDEGLGLLEAAIGTAAAEHSNAGTANG